MRALTRLRVKPAVRVTLFVLADPRCFRRSSELLRRPTRVARRQLVDEIDLVAASDGPGALEPVQGRVDKAAGNMARTLRCDQPVRRMTGDCVPVSHSLLNEPLGTRL